MTELQGASFLAVFGLVCLLAFGLLLNLLCEYVRFPPVFLARRFSYLRWRRLLAWSRMYKELWGDSPPCPEYFVDFLDDIGERWLVPPAWHGSPVEWRRGDCQSEDDYQPESVTGS